MTSDHRLLSGVNDVSGKSSPVSARLSTPSHRRWSGDAGLLAADAAEHGFMHVRWTGRHAVVVVSGDVDLACWPRAQEVHQLLQDWGQPAAVDASAVTFMDLGGLDAVCALGRGEEPLLLLRPSPCVLRLLQVLGAAGCGPVVRDVGGHVPGVVVLRGTAASGGFGGAGADGSRARQEWRSDRD